MRLGEGENKIAELKMAGDVANVIALTDRRLLVFYRNGEESYPLSKITAVKIIFNRVWGMLIAAGVLALSGLAGFEVHALLGLVFLAIAGALAYFGWKGKTYLVIGQMGGDKRCVAKGKSQQLVHFMDAVASKLS